jgi:Mn-dependent DtxR family transcriptional regulator
MSAKEISKKSDALAEVLTKVLRLRDEEAVQLIEALDEVIDARVDDQIDRLFNRGDYRS